MSVPPEPTAALDGTEPARTGAAPDGGTTVTRGDEPGVRPPVPPVADPPVPGSPPAGAPPAPPTAAGPRRLAWVLRPAVIFLASRVVTLATMAAGWAVSGRSILQEIDRWDSRWFLRAAANGWPRHLPYLHGHVTGNTIAFFPVYPLSIRWLSDLTGLPLLASGIVMTSLTGLTAMVGVWALARHYLDQASADRATLLVAVFPGSFVLSMAYSEGFAITFLAFGLLALLQRRWVLAGLLGLLATATTPVALAFEVACLWCAWRAVSGERDWRSLAAPVLAPVGFIAYMVWLWRHTGVLDAWRLTERGGWRSYPSLRWAVHNVVIFVRDPVANTVTTDLLFVGTVVAVVAAVVAIRQRMPMPLLVYGISAAVLGMISAPIGLRPSFLFLAFPLIMAVGIRCRGRRYAVLVVLSIACLVYATAFTVSSHRVFP